MKRTNKLVEPASVDEASKLDRMLIPPAHDPTNPAFVSAVEKALMDFLGGLSERADRIGALPLLETAQACIAGGKRLRPAFCYWGYVAAAGRPADPDPLLRAAASLDLLHASLLVHDDLLDGSDTRRGAPSAHRRFEALLPGPRATRFGEAAAILLGDVLFSWSAEMFESAGLSPEAIRDAAPVLATMRSEVLLGQYLDVAAAFGATDRSTRQAQMNTAEKVLEFKSARYSAQPSWAQRSARPRRNCSQLWEPMVPWWGEPSSCATISSGFSGIPVSRENPRETTSGRANARCWC